jgi:hypothetical protein
MMNSDGKQNGQVTDLYWAVSPILLVSVVDQVRTTLTKMTAEIRATMPDDAEGVPAAVATNSLHFAVTGSGTRSPSQLLRVQTSSRLPQMNPGRGGELLAQWLRGSSGLLVAMVGGFFDLMQAQG